MSKLEFERDIDVSTRYAEGFFNGLILACCHSLSFGIYMAKEDSIAKGTSFKAQYLRNTGKAFLFYSIFSSATYGQRQFILSRREVIMHKLSSVHDIFKRSRALTDITLYMAIFAPLGLALNYIYSGRVLRGTFSMTLLISLMMRAIESGSKTTADFE